jgi:hypothetical protein
MVRKRMSSASPRSYWRLGTAFLILTAIAAVSTLTQVNEFLLAMDDTLQVSRDDDDLDTTVAAGHLHPLSSMHRVTAKATFSIGQLLRPKNRFVIWNVISFHLIRQMFVTRLATRWELPRILEHGQIENEFDQGR